MAPADSRAVWREQTKQRAHVGGITLPGRYPSLPHCSDPVPFGNPTDCSVLNNDTHPFRLCGALRRIHYASCNELANVSFVQEIVQFIGLYRDTRFETNRGQTSYLYGKAIRHVVRGKASRHAGLWQDPLQIATALVRLGSTGIQVRTYVEVGVWTAWTMSVIASY